jgi:hypothetical protein
MGPGTGTPTLAVTTLPAASKFLKSSPMAMVVNNAGIAVGSMAVNGPMPSTLLDISTAAAPASAAFAILSRNWQMPRAMSAIEPAENPAKSASHSLLRPPGKFPESPELAQSRHQVH